MRAAVRRAPTRTPQAGVAMAEFLIGFPPFFLLLLAVIQLALASGARLLVGAAAFSAARAAVVVIPTSTRAADGRDEPPNQIGDGADVPADFAGSSKLRQIRDAAIYVLLPAAPDLSNGAAAAWAPRSLQSALDAEATDALTRVSRKIAGAELLTGVTLHDASGRLRSRFAWNDEVTARVFFLVPCRVPLVVWLAGRRPGELGLRPEELQAAGLDASAVAALPGRFMLLRAEHTMVNQGRPR